MSIRALLAEFEARNGAMILRGRDGGARLVFDGEYVIDIAHADGSPELRLGCTVGPLGDGVKEEVACRLLGANLTGRETGGAALALDEDADEVVLCRSLPVGGLGYDAFEAALTRLVSAAAFWRNIVDGFPEDDAT